MQLSPAVEKYVLHWGEMGTRWGTNRTVAQIQALLYLSPEPLRADQIVDVVESGETLRQNGLVEVETLFEVSSRLVVHPPSLKLRRERIEPLIEGLRRIVEESQAA